MEHLTKLNLLNLKSVLPLPEPETPGNSLEPAECFGLLSFVIDRLDRDHIVNCRGP